MVDYNSYKGKVVAIFGGGGDIGGGCAVELSKFGAKLALIDLDEGRLSQRVKDVKANGVTDKDLFVMLGDMRKPDDVEKAVDGMVAKLGKIDVVINSVGVKKIMSLENTSLEDLDYVLTGNVKTFFMICKTTMKHLVESRGNIVNVSSISGLRPIWGALPYTMAKAACDHMTKCLSVELAPKGVRSNSVCPCALKSDFNLRFNDVFSDPKMNVGYFDNVKRTVPLCTGPMEGIGAPKDVIPAILFFGSDSASFITGVTMAIDGAYQHTAMHPPPKK